MLTSYKQDIYELLELHNFVKKIINCNNFTWEQKQELIYGPKCATRIATLFRCLGIKFYYHNNLESFKEEVNCISFLTFFDNKIDTLRTLLILLTFNERENCNVS